MDKMNMGSLDLKPVVDGIKQELAKAKADLKNEGLNAGEAIGDGWDIGFDDTVEKIKASSIKTEKAFSKLSEKIHKQVQQLSANINGKGIKLKIDFSDIDINSNDIKQKIDKVVKDFSTQGLIEFDTKGSEQQFKNLMTLYVKYQEKLNSLKKVSTSLSSSKDIEVNLQQQLALASELRKIWSFLDGASPLSGYGRDIKDIQAQLEAVQKITKQTQVSDTKVIDNYSELAKVLKEIQDSLKIISDTFKNESNSMQTMAENGVTSFKSLSEVIVSVYNNLSKVQSLVDNISQKNFNITNITQTGGSESSLQAMTQQMAKARETMEHLRQLYDQAGDTLQGLGSKGQIELVMEFSKQLQELNMTDISKSVKKADTEMKLASVIAEMEDYIDKLTQINKLRNQYGLGEWKDTFVSTQKPVTKPIIQQKTQNTTPQVTTSQTATLTSNAETQQMWQLQAAVESVSAAIGRKNAGFIKEKEIVNASVDAEKQKLQELVTVITTSIIPTLDSLKTKFAQSFVSSELNKSNLQASLDDIYNRFVELQGKVNKLVFNVTPKMGSSTDIVNSATNTQQSVNTESQSAIDAAKSFVEAADAKKQFVEANKKVAESAQSSENAVNKEAEAAKKFATDVGNTASKVSKDLAKTRDVYNNNGELIQTDATRKFQTDKAFVSETKSTSITKDTNGNQVETTITMIVKDFERLTKETQKSEEAVNRAQKKLDEFLARFQSKSGGNAKFIEGFNELSKFKVNSNNIEEAFNKMIELQKKYSELETNFRKGQSSLNPFVNAVNKSENIGNIFGDVERQFSSLKNKSEELVNNFIRLQKLSEKIRAFTQLINTNPDAITPTDFTEFSKQVGEFNVLKSQVEGAIKSQSRIESEDSKKQVESYKEILSLIKQRNDALAKAAKADDGSIKQRNALTDAYKIQQQLHILGKQIVLTDEQRTELAKVREEQARRIRDIEADIVAKNENQKASAREKARANGVEDYINLIKQKNAYELKAAKGGAMQSFYNEKVNEFKEKIAQNDKQSIMNQEEKNKLLAIEEEHQRKISELKAKPSSPDNFQKENYNLQKKFEAGYLSEDRFNDWKTQLAEYQNYLNGTVAVDEATIQKKKAILTQLYDQLNKMGNASKTFFASGGEILSKQLNVDEINNAKEALQALYEDIVSDRFNGMKTNVTGFDDTNSKIAKLTFTVDNGRGVLDSYTIALDKASGATALLRGQTKDVATVFQQFGSALKKDVRGIFSAFIGGAGTLYAVGRYIREGIQSVKELDSALTELKKVTDETEKTYDKFLETAGKTSARIGSTLTNMTSATAEFAKLGYGIAEASKMAESALVYTNVGDDVDVETGSQSIISTMKAFGVEANNTMSIVDKFNEVKFLPPYTVMYM